MLDPLEVGFFSLCGWTCHSHWRRIQAEVLMLDWPLDLHIAPAIPAGRPSELASALQYPNTLQKLEIANVGRYFHFL